MKKFQKNDEKKSGQHMLEVMRVNYKCARVGQKSYEDVLVLEKCVSNLSDENIIESFEIIYYWNSSQSWYIVLLLSKIFFRFLELLYNFVD